MEVNNLLRCIWFKIIYDIVDETLPVTPRSPWGPGMPGKPGRPRIFALLEGPCQKHCCSTLPFFIII